MFVSKNKYNELWMFCKHLQRDNNILINDNRKLRQENIKLKNQLNIKGDINGK